MVEREKLDCNNQASTKAPCITSFDDTTHMHAGLWILHRQLPARPSAISNNMNDTSQFHDVCFTPYLAVIWTNAIRLGLAKKTWHKVHRLCANAIWLLETVNTTITGVLHDIVLDGFKKLLDAIEACDVTCCRRLCAFIKRVVG